MKQCAECGETPLKYRTISGKHYCNFPEGPVHGPAAVERPSKTYCEESPNSGVHCLHACDLDATCCWCSKTWRVHGDGLVIAYRRKTAPKR